jgi:regulatory protein YycI of two-component signal transduction system YycFG
MDWSRIKTIFILTFLVLDIYLLYEFLKIHDANKYEFITETSFEDKLSSEEITFVDLPKNGLKDAYVSAKPKVFKKDELLNKLKGQSFTITNDNVLDSVLSQPIKVSGDMKLAELNAFVKSKVIFGEQYKFWDYNKEDRTITYYQQFKGKVFYKNKNGKLTLFINENNEISAYKQTFLEEVEILSDNQEVLPPLKAIETLYDNGLLAPKSKITKVDIGYFTLVQLTASQVLTPTWRFVVDDKENLFVNAFEGQIIQLTDEEKKVVE